MANLELETLAFPNENYLAQANSMIILLAFIVGTYKGLVWGRQLASTIVAGKEWSAMRKSVVGGFVQLAVTLATGMGTTYLLARVMYPPMFD